MKQRLAFVCNSSSSDYLLPVKADRNIDALDWDRNWLDDKLDDLSEQIDLACTLISELNSTCGHMEGILEELGVDAGIYKATIDEIPVNIQKVKELFEKAIKENL